MACSTVNCTFTFTETELFQYSEPASLDFCLLGLTKSEVYKRKVDTRDELLSPILNSAARIEKRVDQLKTSGKVH